MATNRATPWENTIALTSKVKLKDGRAGMVMGRCQHQKELVTLYDIRLEDGALLANVPQTDIAKVTGKAREDIIRMGEPAPARSAAA